MKKEVKLSGNKGDNNIYFTAVFTPEGSLTSTRASELVNELEFLEENDVYIGEDSITSYQRNITIISKYGKLVLQAYYNADSTDYADCQEKYDNVVRDTKYLVEQVESVLTPFE